MACMWASSLLATPQRSPPHLDHLVNQSGVSVLGNEAGANALDLVRRVAGLRARLGGGDHGGGIRFHRDGGDGFAPGLLDVAGDAAEGAAGAHAADQDIDPAPGIFPDFRAGGAFVDSRIGGVLKLARPPVL